jgi:hypothetical protein
MVRARGLGRPFRLFWEHPQSFRSAMPDQFEIFDIALERRGRRWIWRVCTCEEGIVMSGREDSRAAARYKAARALFLLLLSASYGSTRLITSGRARGHSPPRSQREMAS